MHCRRLSHRYAVFVKENKPRSTSEDWKNEKVKVIIAHSRWRPAADVYETDSKIYISTELAGVKPEEIDIALYEDALVVEGVRRLPLDGQGGVYHAAEIRQGPFCLEILLPTRVDAEKVDAQYEHGVLRIVLRKLKGG
jgi:HSP20 family protein